MNILFRAVTLLAAVLSACNTPVDKQQTRRKGIIQSDTTGLLIQRELADSPKLTHIKGQFYRSKDGHLYERTFADREINGSDSLASVEYFNGQLPQDIDPLTFVVLDGWYAKDKHFAYYYRPTSGGMLAIKMDKADVKTFKIFEGHYQYAVDKSHVYKDSEILENINPGKARVITDKNGEILSIK